MFAEEVLSLHVEFDQRKSRQGVDRRAKPEEEERRPCVELWSIVELDIGSVARCWYAQIVEITAVGA